MRRSINPWLVVVLGILLPSFTAARAQTIHQTPLYQRIRSHLESVPAIDTHSHLWPFGRLRSGPQPGSEAMDLSRLWQHSVINWARPIPARTTDEPFERWWSRAGAVFPDLRAMSLYRSMLPAFEDLYGVDFDRLTEDGARELDRRISANYRDARWLCEVITGRANIELIFTDPYWYPLRMGTVYPFEVTVLNVNSLLSGFHRAEAAAAPGADPYRFADERGLPVETLDDYLRLLERIMAEAREKGVVGLKLSVAYHRPLRFQNVPRTTAAALFGRPKAELTWEQLLAFQDFILWRIAELSATHDLPLQIHTGMARLQGSNPLLLIDLIEANPRTRFVLLHGGFPWVTEVGAMAMHRPNVWVDAVWLPMLSVSVAKRAFHEWLDMLPADRILWGTDSADAEGIYGAAAVMRRCWAEVLAERVAAGELNEEDALRIGRLIFRDNALSLFPALRHRLWKTPDRLLPDSMPAEDAQY